MKVNSFFCGAGGFDQGFIQAGFEIAGAWDYDPKGPKTGEQPQIKSYRHNVGDHVKQMDVMLMTGSDVPKANGWLFGFPCQDISIAGKQAGMIKGQTRSGLFYEIMRLLGEVSDKPEWILAENVKAVNKFIPTIEEEYDKAGYRLVSPQLYNSKYWGVPQNRERYFLLGIRKDLSNTFVFPEQQTDFIPKLSSVLESEVDEKYYMSDEKAKVIIERVLEGLKVKQATKLGYDIAKEGDTINISHPNSTTRRGRVGKQVAQTILTGQEQVVVEPIQDSFTDKDGVAYCIDANYHKGVGPSAVGKGKRTQVVEPVIVHNIYGGFNEKEPRIFEDYAPTIRTAAGGGHIPSVMEQIPVLYNRKDGIKKEIDISGALMSSDWRGLNQNQSKAAVVEMPEYRIRKLTPRETARLQGFPDSFEFIVSDTQIYRQMGNAVTVNVAYAIAKAIGEQL